MRRCFPSAHRAVASSLASEPRARLSTGAAAASSCTFDYIIVGSGTAGSLIYSRLASLPNPPRILLLESGGAPLVPLNTPWLHVPLGYLYTMTMPSTSWGFTTKVADRTIHYPRGRILGGCSHINGMIYQEGNPGDYDAWNAEGWGSEEMEQAFQELGGRREGGEWPVENQRLSWEVLDDWGAAASESGVPWNDDFVNSRTESVGYFRVNQRKGIRMSAWQAFVDDRRLGLKLGGKAELGTVRSGCTATRLLFSDADPTQVTGIEFLPPNSNQPETAYAPTTILASGAVGSPHLLQVSGVGPAELLESKGVKTRHDLSEVGQNLHDHLQLRQVFRLNSAARTLNTLASSLVGKVRMGLEYILNQSGPLSMAPSQLGAFVKSDESLAFPNCQYHVQPLSLPAFGEPLHPFPGMTAAICNLQPTSRGSIELSSPDIRSKPVIDCQYLTSEEDLKVAARGLRITREIMSNPAMQKYAPEEILPGLEASTNAELGEAAKRIGTSIFHPVGTCAIGTVVDESLKVKGLSGLRICDASVMPRITSGNTNSPTLAMAQNFVGILKREEGLVG